MGSQLPDRNLKSRRDGAHYPFVAPSLSDFCPTLLGSALHLTVQVTLRRPRQLPWHPVTRNHIRIS